MKITKIRTLCLSRPHEPERQWRTATFLVPKADAAVVVIDTDEGLRGIGEACAYGDPPRIRAEVERLAPGLLGRDPRETDLAPRPVGLNAPVDTAVAGIDAALWDLRGRLAKRPVAELLALPGQQPLHRVRLYASGGVNYDWENRPESVVDEAVGYAEAGFTAFKMRIGTHWEWAGVTVPRFIALLRQVTEAVGKRMELMLDGNQRLSEAQALQVAQALDEMGWTWFEEPIPQTDVEGYARLNAAVKLPVTGGEQYTTVEQFEPYLAARAYAIVQADGGWCGLTEGMRIARRAWEFGVPMCPHNWHNGLMTMANAHLVAALPFPKVLEVNMFQGPLQWQMLRQPPRIKDGYLELPAGPGLGVELAEDVEERFPYVEGPWGVKVER
ncbi:MAG: mandelate racemase/muconate lactonizing enzyme family protein [Candidatus Latescibacteria bacterium]|nr:mandelate racemase/muconate lactonizing enzyme family protein [Candidatus Latescibacterota bacterium]